MKVSIVKLVGWGTERTYVEEDAHEVVFEVGDQEIAIRRPLSKSGLLSIYVQGRVLIFGPVSSNHADVWTEPYQGEDDD